MKLRAAIELSLVLAVAPAVYLGAGALGLHAPLQQDGGALAQLHVADLLYALLAVSLALVVFALRRWREALALLRTQEQAEAALGEQGRRHRDLAHRLIAQQEAERRQLARQVRDHLDQTASVVRSEAAALLPQADTAVLAGGLRRIASAADELHESCNDLLALLRPQDVEALGLPAALQALLLAWEPGARVATAFHPEGEFDGLDPAVSLALYRIVQDALANVLRHARATRVAVRLARLQHGGADTIRLVVEDDGTGRRARGRAAPGARAPLGLGLIGMHERAVMVGGGIGVHDLKPHGFAVECRVPFTRARRRAGATGGPPAALAPHR
jgi:signal transduction histidine kinase